MSRITKRFEKLKADKRAGLVIYISAGDPNAEVGYEILKGLPAAGADLIELGMPFTDPMADGPSIQVAGQRALKAGMTVDGTFDMVRRFRKETGDDDTPILLMGYYNLVYQRGVERFCKEAAAAGVDGFILVDLPPEEADELKPHAEAHGLDTVLLTAPTTDDKRLPAVLKYSAGFVYFVSVLGITGTKSATEEAVATHVARIKRHTKLPVGVGFGIRTPEQAAAVARHADAAVVGTAIVDRVKAGLDAQRQAQARTRGRRVRRRQGTCRRRAQRQQAVTFPAVTIRGTGPTVIVGSRSRAHMRVDQRGGKACRRSTSKERTGFTPTSSLHWIFSMLKTANPIAGKRSASPTRWARWPAACISSPRSSLPPSRGRSTSARPTCWQRLRRSPRDSPRTCCVTAWTTCGNATVMRMPPLICRQCWQPASRTCSR